MFIIQNIRYMFKYRFIDYQEVSALYDESSGTIVDGSGSPMSSYEFTIFNVDSNQTCKVDYNGLMDKSNDILGLIFVNNEYDVKICDIFTVSKEAYKIYTMIKYIGIGTSSHAIKLGFGEMYGIIGVDETGMYAEYSFRVRSGLKFIPNIIMDFIKTGKFNKFVKIVDCERIGIYIEQSYDELRNFLVYKISDLNEFMSFVTKCSLMSTGA